MSINVTVGKIPEAIGNLKALIEIDFRRNEIGGKLSGCITNQSLSYTGLIVRMHSKHDAFIIKSSRIVFI